MTWSLDTLLVLIGSSGVTGAGVALLVVWLWKTWISEKIRSQIQHEYSTQLEILKNKLKAEADVEIENLKSRLSIAAAERQYRFSRLHEMRAGVIAEVYAALRDALFAMSDYVNIVEIGGSTPRRERGKIAADAGRKFGQLYHSKRIFIPKDTATKLDAVNRGIVESFNVFQFMVDVPANPDAEAWRDTYRKISTLSQSALEDLEGDLRRLLGDEQTT